jgi:uncharacterized protein (TIGR02246 family)
VIEEGSPVPTNVEDLLQDADLLSRIDRVESRLDLRDLVSRYCKACDDRDLAAMADLFAPDGAVTTGDGSTRHEGRDAVIAMFAQSQTSMHMTNHWVHDHLLSFTSPDEASGTAFAHVEANVNGTAMIGAIRYHDDYARCDGKWRFSKRHIEMIYFCPAIDFPEVVGQFRPSPSVS